MTEVVIHGVTTDVFGLKVFNSFLAHLSIYFSHCSVGILRVAYVIFTIEVETVRVYSNIIRSDLNDIGC